MAKTLRLDENFDYCIIGDIHSCLDELKELISDNKGWRIDEQGMMHNTSIIFPHKETPHSFKFILIGDYLDKGPQLTDTIEFIYQNRKHFIIVKGNHENFAYKYLTGARGSYQLNKDLIEGYFNSIFILEKFPKLREKFFTLFSESYDFVDCERFIVTHAPCKKEYLGGTDKKAIDSQRNFVYPKRKDYDTEENYLQARKEAFAFLNEKLDTNQYHIFGHVITKEVFNNEHRIGIDTGCADGGALSCVMFYHDMPDIFFSSYKSKKGKMIDLNKELIFENA